MASTPPPFYADTVPSTIYITVSSSSSSSSSSSEDEVSRYLVKRRKVNSWPEKRRKRARSKSQSRSRSSSSLPPSSLSNKPDMIQFLMGDLTQPSPLLDISARSLAQYYNNLWQLPPLGWLEIVECLILVHLHPVLFLRYLRLRGGIKQLYQDYSNVNFQYIVKKLFHIFYDLPRMPLRFRSYVVREINQWSTIVLQSEKTEHALFRLGLGHCTQLEKAEKLETGRIDEENGRMKQGIDFNHRLLRFYRNWQRQMRNTKTSMQLSLPISPRVISSIGWHSPFCQLQNWIERHQKTFKHANPLPALPMRNFDVLQDFLILNPTSKCYELLLAADTAARKQRHHCAAFLSVYLLDTTPPLMRSLQNIKIYILAMLAVSLAAFNCRMDSAVEMIRRMNQHIIFPSDKALVLLTKMKVLRAHGYAFKVNTIFEHIQNDQIFHKRSHYYFEALVIWSNALLDRSFNIICELWLAKMERQSQAKTGETSWEQSKNDEAVIIAGKKRVARCRNALVRLCENLQDESSHCSPETKASNVIPELEIRQSAAMGLMNCILERPHSVTIHLWKRTLLKTPNALKTSPLTELMRAFCNHSSRSASISDFKNERSAYIRHLELKSDWSQNPQVACANFEMLTFLCVSDLMEKSAPKITQDILQETLSCYENLSNRSSNPLPRLVLLKRLQLWFNKMPSNAPAREVIGICGRQMKQNVSEQDWIAFHSSSQRACQDLTDLEALKWFMLREENSRIKALLTFGFQSVMFQNGV